MLQKQEPGRLCACTSGCTLIAPVPWGCFTVNYLKIYTCCPLCWLMQDCLCTSLLGKVPECLATGLPCMVNPHGVSMLPLARSRACIRWGSLAPHICPCLIDQCDCAHGCVGKRNREQGQSIAPRRAGLRPRAAGKRDREQGQSSAPLARRAGLRARRSPAAS